MLHRHLVAGALIAACAVHAPLQAQAPARVDFRRDVQPILKGHCYECHGPTQQMNGFRLDRRRDALRGGSQSVIGPGNADGSRLYQRLIGTRFGTQMPPTGPLGAEAVGVLKAWIDQGVEWPDDLSGEAPPPIADPKVTRLVALLRAGETRAFTKAVRQDPAIVHLRGHGGATPLMFAALYGDEDTVRVLLDLGADATATNAAGATALMWAADSAATTRLLIAHGADPNARSEEGRTPIMVAAGRVGTSAVVKMLLDAGARPLGLQQAARAGNEDVFRLLIEHGADMKAPGAPSLAQVRNFCPKCAELVPADVAAALPAGVPAAAPSPPAAVQPDRPATVYAVTAVSTAPPSAAHVRAAVERSLPLLQKYDVAFVQRTGCVSCHNNSLTAMTVAAARRHGYRVDGDITAQQNKRVGAYIESWLEGALQVLTLGGLQDTVSYILFGLMQGEYAPDMATDAMARYLKGQQQPDGRWRTLTTRPPMEGSDITVTALSMRSLQHYAPPSLRSEYVRAIQRAADWVTTAPARDNEDRTFQLLGLTWAGARRDVLERAARALLAEQRPDGGWAQLPSLNSDAYATGQALVALRESGMVKPGDARVRRGVQFLLTTQRDDGSWYVPSRAKPIQPLFELGFPHGRDQWISSAATGWATTALVLAGR